MADLKEKLIADRRKLLGPNCALNFSKDPLVILRGEKQWLYDEHGLAYLDVSHLGQEWEGSPRPIDPTSYRSVSTMSATLAVSCAGVCALSPLSLSSSALRQALSLS